MLEEVTLFIEKNNLIESGSTVIVGLSGGPDSVSLLHLLHTLRSKADFTLIAVHIDHEWRVDSGKDALFCKEFAQSLQVPFILRKASESLIKKNNGSLEEFGRRIRRSFFEEIARSTNTHTIALGHHAQDQQETFFLRLIRGASISGLASIRPRQGLYIRPLLKTTKEHILSYLKKHSLPYCIDSTNDDAQYLRNALRLNILPALKSCDPRFEKNFNSTLDHIQQTESFLERTAAESFNRVFHKNENRLTINIPAFFAEDSFLHHRLILLWLCQEGVPFTPSTSLFHEIVRFLSNRGASHQITPHWCLTKKGIHAFLTKGFLTKKVTQPDPSHLPTS